MTQHRFQVAELTLGFRLPIEFWKPYEASYSRLVEILESEGESLVCSGPKELLAFQEAATEAALCVHEEIVEWWGDFFAIGETGDGGYFLMKRAGSQSVWLMDSDWYEEPHVAADNFESFLESLKNGQLP